MSSARCASTRRRSPQSISGLTFLSLESVPRWASPGPVTLVRFQPETFEVGQSADVDQSGIAHTRRVEMERAESGQLLEMRQPGVGYLRPSEDSDSRAPPGDQGAPALHRSPWSRSGRESGCRVSPSRWASPASVRGTPSRMSRCSRPNASRSGNSSSAIEILWSPLEIKPTSVTSWKYSSPMSLLSQAGPGGWAFFRDLAVHPLVLVQDSAIHPLDRGDGPALAVRAVDLPAHPRPRRPGSAASACAG